MRNFVRGVMHTNGAGFGFLICDPNGLIANDVDSVYSANQAGGATSPQLNEVAYQSNSEYTNAQIGPAATQAQYRLIAACARIRYVGPELTRGGQVLGFCDPDHGTLVNKGYSTIDAEMESRKFEVNRKWKTVYYRPAVNAEFDFQTVAYRPFTSAYADYMGFLVRSTDILNILSFEFEVYSVFEVNGRTVRGRTPSISDPSGFAAVQSTLTLQGLAPNEKTPDESEKSLVVSTNTYADKHLTSTTTKPTPTKESHGFDWMGLLNTGVSLLPSLLSFL